MYRNTPPQQVGIHAGAAYPGGPNGQICGDRSACLAAEKNDLVATFASNGISSNWSVYAALVWPIAID